MLARGFDGEDLDGTLPPHFFGELAATEPGIAELRRLVRDRTAPRARARATAGTKGSRQAPRSGALRGLPPSRRDTWTCGLQRSRTPRRRHCKPKRPCGPWCDVMCAHCRKRGDGANSGETGGWQYRAPSSPQGHVGSKALGLALLSDAGGLDALVNVAETALVLSVRATAFHALCLVGQVRLASFQVCRTDAGVTRAYLTPRTSWACSHGCLGLGAWNCSTRPGRWRWRVITGKQAGKTALLRCRHPRAASCMWPHSPSKGRAAAGGDQRTPAAPPRSVTDSRLLAMATRGVGIWGGGGGGPGQASRCWTSSLLLTPSPPPMTVQRTRYCVTLCSSGTRRARAGDRAPPRRC